jgi:hypothetical protein
MHFAECLFWLAIIVVTVVALRRRGSDVRADAVWSVAFLFELALASLLAEDVWSEQWSFMRVLGDLFVVSVAIVLGGRAPARWTAAVATAGLWLYVVSHIE